MASKKNIRAKAIAENRTLLPAAFRDNRVEAVKPDIWITPELKAAARAVQNAWSASHGEQMVDLNIQEVGLKFPDQAKRMAFYEALAKLAELVDPNFPRSCPLPKPDVPQSPNPIEVVWLNFHYKYFLPATFDTVTEDVAATNLSTIPFQLEILNQAKAYLAAYGPGFVRMKLGVDENVDQSAVDSLTNSLSEAQRRLMNFLQQLVHCMADPEMHRVVILADGRFEVDGVEKKFTGAALRALLALALLRMKANFRLEEFAPLYHGGDTSDARTDFDNAMTALKKELCKRRLKSAAGGARKVPHLPSKGNWIFRSPSSC